MARVTRAAVQELLEQLVAIDSVNPTLVPGGAGEGEIARFVSSWLDRNGIECEYQELGGGRANVLGRVRGSGGGRTLLLNAHMDTVALGGDDAGVAPRVEGARLYGRGAYDMKGGLAAIMLAAAALPRDLAGDVVVAAVADEEALSIGTEAVVEGGVQADAAIVTEPTDLDVAVAHKGFVWLELETTGVAAHGSRYDLGVDAIVRMGPALVGLAELDRRLRVDGAPHPLLGGPSLHASLIEGGHELSSYPDRCVLKVERRTLPGETVAAVEDQVRAVAGEASVKMLFARQPLETSEDEPFVQTLLGSAATASGRAPAVIGVSGWMDASLFAGAGIPTVIFGPSGTGAHADVEWVDLDSVARCVDVLLATAEAFCA